MDGRQRGPHAKEGGEEKGTVKNIKDAFKSSLICSFYNENRSTRIPVNCVTWKYDLARKCVEEILISNFISREPSPGWGGE